jgi:hypothetical protein
VSEKEERAQDKPKTFWEEKGFSSVEEMYAALNEDKAVADARARALEGSMGVPKPPVRPKFDKEAYENDPEGYTAKYEKALERYEEDLKTAPTVANKAALNAAVAGVLERSKQRGLDSDIVHATMKSMVANDPSMAGRLNSPSGIEELGNLAMEKLKAQMAPPPAPKEEHEVDEDEDELMGKGVPPEHKDSPGRSSQEA